MSDKDLNNSDLGNNNLHDDRTPDIQQGESKTLSGGRRLTKFPLIIIGCVVGLVLFLTALAMMKAGNSNDAVKEEEQAQNTSESANPDDLFANTGSGSIPESNLQNPGCLEPVLDPQGQPIINTDGTPLQQPCGGTTPQGQPVTAGLVEGSPEDIANKRRIMLLEAERRNIDMNLQAKQAEQQAVFQSKMTRLQGIEQQRANAQNDLGAVLGAPTSTGNNSAGLKAVGGSQPSNSGLGGLLGGANNSHGGDGFMPGGGSDKNDMYAVNRQGEKEQWTQRSSNDNFYLSKALIDPMSDYEVKTGTVIPATLVTGMNSDLPGQIIGQVRQNVYDSTSGRFLLIPQGSKLIGTYDNGITMGQQRGLIAWQRIIFPNGSSMSLGTMQGTDKAGYAGFKDKVDNHYGRIFGQATLISMFSALGQIAVSDNNSNSNQSNAQDNRETLAEELGRQWSQTGQELIKRNLNIAPTIRIRPGYEFNVMVNKDMILKPYHK
ncbi:MULTISPECIES: TrbI/VirB10 family protein [unclassified Acinetobacter]|uniref:TrbI/VirB10 family protein n=1 Tax=unclassified Acinetobacter TaxID=196816 RepID=UPI0015D2C608|nr:MULTISPECIES: TrbI/VirB10 family protein [unclassified Acinetobacter]UUS62547.1 hypothetical protein MST17_16695 [Acinetobacter sp. YH16056_T]